MNVLSLFDGMSCGQIALERAGIKVDNYFASEIDKYAIQVTQKNYPNTKQIGSVVDVKGEYLPKIDLLIGGSPCQGFSFAGKQLNFEDPRSSLFFEFVRLLKECKPKYFLLENVKMKKEYEQVITEYLGVEPIEINSSLVSAQNRKRLYWTNLPNITQPQDINIALMDILEDNVASKFNISEASMKRYVEFHTDDGSNLILGTTALKGKIGQRDRVYSSFGKSAALTATDYKQPKQVKVYNQLNPNYKSQANTIYNENDKSPTLCAGTHGYALGYIKRGTESDFRIRRFTPIECERLQTVPDNYTEGVSNTQRYKMLGNGWTVDVIAHIFKNIK